MGDKENRPWGRQYTASGLEVPKCSRRRRLEERATRRPRAKPLPSLPLPGRSWGAHGGRQAAGSNQQTQPGGEGAVRISLRRRGRQSSASKKRADVPFLAESIRLGWRCAPRRGPQHKAARQHGGAAACRADAQAAISRAARLLGPLRSWPLWQLQSRPPRPVQEGRGRRCPAGQPAASPRGRPAQRAPHSRPRSCITRFMVAPICAGEGVTVTPAASSAAILSPALPLPPAAGDGGRGWLSGRLKRATNGAHCLCCLQRG